MIVWTLDESWTHISSGRCAATPREADGAREPGCCRCRAAGRGRRWGGGADEAGERGARRGVRNAKKGPRQLGGLPGGAGLPCRARHWLPRRRDVHHVLVCAENPLDARERPPRGALRRTERESTSNLRHFKDRGRFGASCALEGRAAGRGAAVPRNNVYCGGPALRAWPEARACAARARADGAAALTLPSVLCAAAPFRQPSSRRRPRAARRRRRTFLYWCSSGASRSATRRARAARSRPAQTTSPSTACGQTTTTAGACKAKAAPGVSLSSLRRI